MTRQGPRGLDKSDTATSVLFRRWHRKLRERDKHLAKRVVEILRKLLLLADGAVSTYAGYTTKGKSQGNAPRGARQSPFDHYLRFFLDSPNDFALAERLREAEREYAAIIGRPEDAPHRRADAAEAFGDDGAAMEEAQAQRILIRYEGKTPQEAARMEGDERLADWIEKVRRLSHRDLKTGKSQPAWDRWDKETRVEEIRQLRQRRMNQPQVAQHLSVPRSTIQRYWDDAHPLRKAA